MGTVIAIAARVIMHVIYSEHFSRVAHEVMRQATREVIRHIYRRTHQTPRYGPFADFHGQQ